MIERHLETPAAEHGFVLPSRTGIYHPAAAERHGERLFGVFAHTLGRRG